MRFFWGVIRWGARSVWLLAFLAMLAFNALTLTFNGFAAAVSAFYSAATGVHTVYDTLRQKVDDLDANLGKARQEVETVTQDRNATRAKADTLETDLNRANRELDAVGGERDVLRRRATTLETDLAEARRPPTVLRRGETVLLRDFVEETTQRVASRTTKVAVANVTSMAGEGIPVLGIALIVASVTFDLTSACDTMKDMDALRIALDPTLAPDPNSATVCATRVPTADEVWDDIKASPGAVWNAAKSILGSAAERVPSWDQVKSAPGDLWNAFTDFVRSIF